MKKIISLKAVLVGTAFFIFSGVCLAQESSSELFYSTFKNGTNDKNLVFVHGTPGNGEGFKEYLQEKTLRSKYNMVSVDRLGFGKSQKKVELSFDVQNAAIDDVVQKEFANKKVTCVGHSYGGPLCLKLLIDKPEIYEKALVIAGVFNPYRKIVRWYNNLASLWLVKWILPRDLSNSNKEMYNLKRELKKLEQDFSKLKGRVKIIHGVEDKIVPVGDGDWLYDKLKGKDVERLRVKKAGHFIIWKDFDLIKEELINFY